MNAGFKCRPFIPLHGCMRNSISVVSGVNASYKNQTPSVDYGGC